jgi:hypothetical protein
MSWDGIPARLAAGVFQICIQSDGALETVANE